MGEQVLPAAGSGFDAIKCGLKCGFTESASHRVYIVACGLAYTGIPAAVAAALTVFRRFEGFPGRACPNPIPSTWDLLHGLQGCCTAAATPAPLINQVPHLPTGQDAYDRHQLAATSRHHCIQPCAPCPALTSKTPGTPANVESVHSGDAGWQLLNKLRK